MAKFTKLNIGDSVASSGGRAWKKLSAEPPIDYNTLVGTWIMNGTPTKWDGITSNTCFTITGDVNCGAYTAPIGRYFCLFASTDSTSNVNTNVKSDKTSVLDLDAGNYGSSSGYFTDLPIDILSYIQIEVTKNTYPTNNSWIIQS